MCFVLGLIMVLVAAPKAHSADDLPGWLVPVVRMVADDRIILSTGVYLGEGQVLVPSEFTADDTRLLVLDGGADLARFGRAAVVKQRFRLDGLALLQVAGLQRPLPRLGVQPPQSTPTAGVELALEAFPPPELIADGRTNMSLRSGAVLQNGQWTLDINRPLPNLTGALVNACGDLIGHSAARGIASMSTSSAAQLRWGDTLLRVLNAAGIRLEQSPCEADWPKPAEPPAPDPALDDPATQAEGPKATPDPVAEAVEPEVAATVELAEPETAEPDLSADVAEPVLVPEAAVDHDAQQSEKRSAVTLGIFSGAVLLVVLLLLLVLWRRKLAASDRWAAGPSAAIGVIEHLDYGELENARVVGQLVSADITHSVYAHDGVVDIVLGRYDSDVLLHTRATSRQHARISGASGQFRIEDLGSSNGTFVNGTRLTVGQVVSLVSGDEVLFAQERYEWQETGRGNET